MARTCAISVSKEKGAACPSLRGLAANASAGRPRAASAAVVAALLMKVRRLIISKKVHSERCAMAQKQHDAGKNSLVPCLCLHIFDGLASANSVEFASHWGVVAFRHRARGGLRQHT